MIKVKAKVGYDLGHKKETEIGVIVGKSIYEEIKLTDKEARDIIQGLVDKMAYMDAQDFAKKYKK